MDNSKQQELNEKDDEKQRMRERIRQQTLEEMQEMEDYITDMIENAKYVIQKRQKRGK